MIAVPVAGPIIAEPRALSAARSRPAPCRRPETDGRPPRLTMASDLDRILRAVDSLAGELVSFTADLIAIPTVNPPGEAYEPCARRIGDTLRGFGFETQYYTADGCPEHRPDYPRVNVVGVRRGRRARPCVHLNGHLDVVPAGDGWTVEPFGRTVRGGRIYGRGSSDMKGGLAAAIFAAEAIRRAGVTLEGTVEISGTVDEESGGFAGVAWLARQGVLSSDREDFVIIPEPFGVDRISVGHRGVYWCEITTVGRTAHGSMPFFGVNAVDAMAEVLANVQRELVPTLSARRTAMPVVPDGARAATLNVNGIRGGQADVAGQTPCVPDRCVAVLDRRFLPEEPLEAVRAEIADQVARALDGRPGIRHEMRDLMIVEPVRTPDGSPVVTALAGAVREIVGREAQLVASPGTYDQKHVKRIAGIEHCVAYGPGYLDLAHQPDEWVGIDDLVTATKVLAAAVLRLAGGAAPP